MTTWAQQEFSSPRSGSNNRSRPTDHVASCLRIDGVFDAELARGALILLTERHARLRTLIPVNSVTPTCTSSRSGVIDFVVMRTSQENVIAHAVREVIEPFDLARGPLLRVRVLIISDRECFLVAVAHRLVFDPALLDTFLVEHARAYTAVRLGVPVTALPTTRPTWPTANEIAIARDHWRRRLSQVPLLDLPPDFPRQYQPERTGSVANFTLPADLTRRMRALSGESGDHDALLAGVVALLARSPAQGEVPILAPVSPVGADGHEPLGRPETDVLLSFHLDSDSTFLDVVGQARAGLAQARTDAAGLLPGTLAELAATCGDPGPKPVLVGFAARTPSAAAPDYAGASCVHINLHTGTAAQDLSFSFNMRAGEWQGALEYDTRLFEPVTAQRIVRRLVHLLAAAVDSPHAPAATLPILPPEERALVVSEWNRTEREFPSDRTTVSLFKEHVLRAPDATAVVYEDMKLTYEELDVRANRLAHRLIESGVHSNMPVGLCLHKSVDMVVGLLAILKAGGAYLPLDPDYPPQRLAYVVADAGARVILTDTSNAHLFGETVARVLCLDVPDSAGDDRPTTDPRVPGSAAHLAYVIYTSGSTGVPKGVAVSQRALSRLVKGADYARFGPDEVHLQLSPLSFDASLLEVWGALLNGGTLVVPPSGLPFPDVLKAALQRHRITILLLVSPQLHMAVEQFPKELARVSQLLVGGDVLSPASAARLLPYLQHTEFLHVYGPTECTLFATWKPIKAADTSRPTIPIGRPLANTQAYVLNEDLAPLPVGIPGDLWLSGDGLADGYLGQPGLTAERFLPDPFGPLGSRIYSTGDLARWLPDGNLEFLGRSDDQVKIRGYRIELGEVDAALAVHPDIRAVATVVRDDTPGGRALAAYLVGDPRISDAELREFIGARLPSYMIPAAFVWLNELPLTANGKVDRKSLPEPKYGRLQRQTVPRTRLEGRVLEIIAEALGLAGVAPDDDFFALGGNSLLMVDLFDSLERTFPGCGLSLLDLLENRTGAQIATLLEASRGQA